MKTSHIIILFFVAAIAAFVFYSMSGSPSDEGYAIAIKKEREEKNTFMKGDDSPFKNNPEAFVGLNYFPADIKYRLVARLESIENKKVVTLSTSDGKQQQYLEYAFAVFNLNEVNNKLLLLEIMDMGSQRGKLFLAFADSTSGRETYGAGRYLDVKKVPGATSISLDFNLAYNPYCAYSDAFSCPFPPQENILKIAIKAGEKSYDK